MALSTRSGPGAPVRGSATGRPIMAAFDLLGRRWTLRIIGELGEGPVRFNEMQRRLDGASSSVLSTRLRELVAVGIAQVGAGGLYELSEVGRALLIALAPLWKWSDTWAEALGATPNEPVSDALLEATLGAEPPS